MFSFTLSQEIKLPKLLPKDPGGDLIVRLPLETYCLQRAILAEYSKYFQSLTTLKGLSEITLSPELGNPELIARVFQVIYGEKACFHVTELIELDKVLDNLDCKKLKELFKLALKEEVLKTESLEFFLRVFDHFAIRDHKKFCKESLRRLNELKFFANISIELETSSPRTVLPNLSLVSERGIIKLLALLLQDETRKRGGEKAKNEVCAILEKALLFYAKEILNRPERGPGLFEELMLETNPLDKKFIDKDVIKTFLTEIQQLKKTNQSLNTQIQGLRSKENENKKRLNVVIKRLEVLEGILKVKPIPESSFQASSASNITCFNATCEGKNKDCEHKNKETNQGQEKNNEKQEKNNEKQEKNNEKQEKNNEKQEKTQEKQQPKFENKFKGYLANEENKKKTQQLKNSPLNQHEETKESILKKSEGAKKSKSPFGLFNNEKDLSRLLDHLRKSHDDFKSKSLTFSRLFEGSKQSFRLQNLCEMCAKDSTPKLLFIRTQIDKTLGVFLAKGLEANSHREDPKSFIFLMSPFQVFPLRAEFKSSPVVHLTEESLKIGQDLIIGNEGDKNHSSMEIPRCYGDDGDDMMKGILAGVKSFLMKEMIVIEVKVE